MTTTRISIDVDIDHDDNVSLEDIKSELLQTISGRKNVDWVQIVTETELDQ